MLRGKTTSLNASFQTDYGNKRTPGHVGTSRSMRFICTARRNDDVDRRQVGGSPESSCTRTHNTYVHRDTYNNVRFYGRDIIIVIIYFYFFFLAKC